MEELRDYSERDLQDLEVELDDASQAIKAQLRDAKEDAAVGLRVNEEWRRKAEHARRRTCYRLNVVRNELARRRRDRNREFDTNFQRNLVELLRKEVSGERFSELRTQALEAARSVEAEEDALIAAKEAREHDAWREMEQHEAAYRQQGATTYRDRNS